MGLFNFFTKKNKLIEGTEDQKELIKSEIVLDDQNKKELIKSALNQVELIKPNEVLNYQNSEFGFHEDLRGLLWFSDGPFQNYINENIEKHTFDCNWMRLSFRFSGDDEPSLIYTKQLFIIPNEIDMSLVEKPPYCPTYSGLTPEQKMVYIKLLQNPYDAGIDIGFVFLLYYGLERHLLVGDYARACNVILKLREVHKNGSVIIGTSRGWKSNQFIESDKVWMAVGSSDILLRVTRVAFEDGESLSLDNYSYLGHLDSVPKLVDLVVFGKKENYPESDSVALWMK